MLPFQVNSDSFLQDHVDALAQGAHCFVSLTLNKLLSKFPTDNSLLKKYYRNNCEFHEIVTK